MNNSKLVTAIIGIIILIVLSLSYWIFPVIDNNDFNIDIINSTQNKCEENLKIYFFNVGNADCTLIISKSEAMLIDGGNKADAKYICDYIREELEYYNLKYIIATHADRDHIGGLPTIIENMNSVEEILMPNTDKQTVETKNIINSANIKNIPIINPRINSEYTLGDSKFKIKWVATETEGEKDNNGKINNAVKTNQSSIVIELEYRDKKFLFMGDYEELSETNKYYKEINWSKVDLIKVAHHGSKSNLIKEFYTLTNPKYAIISAGDNNNYKLPDLEVINAITEETRDEENNSAIILVTKESDTILIESDGIDIFEPIFINEKFDGNRE